jgi:RNA polymerase sigma factor (sigma-70 family)
MERPDHTASGADDPVFTALWVAHRRRMLDLAFRMLLDFPDAEDVVQEAFTRLARTNIAALADPEGWLVIVTSRLCLDRLRTRRRRPADALDLAGDPFDPHALDPASQVALVDNVTMAMHALLERLSPAERTSFVLHDVFQYPFEEVAIVVGRSPASCRQLASRARRTLQAESATGRFPVDFALHRQVSERFIQACTGRRSGRPADIARSGRRGCRRCRSRRAGRGRRSRSGNNALPRTAGLPLSCCTCPSVTGSASSPSGIVECWRSSC